MSKIILLLGVLAVLLTAVSVGGCDRQAAPASPVGPEASVLPPQTQVIKWKFQTHLTQNVINTIERPDKYQGWVRFAQRVNDMSGGRLQIEVYQGGALVPELHSLDLVGKGVLQAASAGPLYWTDTLPLCEFSDFPMLFGSNHDEARYLWLRMGLLELMREEYAKANVYLAGIIMTGNYGAIASRKNITTLDDLEGIKMRSYGLVATLWGKFGASIVSIPASEAYKALQSGVVDAANLGGLGSFYTNKIHEVADYFLLPPILDAVRNDFFVNMEAWNALPADLQNILIVSVMATDDELSASENANEAYCTQQLYRVPGLTFNYLSIADQTKLRQTALQMLDERAARDAESAQVAALIKQAMKIYGYIQ